MPLDHQHSADQLTADIKVLDESLIHAETIGQARAWTSIKQSLYGLSDWHEAQAKKQQQSENIYNLADLHKSADQALTKTN